MLNILIIDSNPAEANAPFITHQGRTIGQNYAHALTTCHEGLNISIIAPYDGDPMPDLTDYGGVVFTGSSVDWTTDDPRAAPLAEIMRKVFAKGLPTLGSCNGMQLAASVLGGASQPSPNGREDGLARGVQMTEAGRDHPLLKGREDGFAVPCVHRDVVTQVPEGAVVLAYNDHADVQAMAYEQDGVRFWGVQYHPEIDPANLGPSMARMGWLPEDEARDLQVAETDPDAPARLGVRASDMTPEARITELRNWLASL